MIAQVYDADYKPVFAETSAGVCLFFKKLCPHCLNMEKVLEKFSARMPDVRLYAMDAEENPEAAREYGAQRAPTLVVIKDGKAAAVRAGLMNPKEMLALYEQVFQM
jgi:thioredoxin 1